MRCLLVLFGCLVLSFTSLCQNVGIGTSTPITKLTVQTPSGSFGITHTDGTVQLSTLIGGGQAVLGTFSGHPLVFYSNALNRMTITSSGNVGIGTLSPARKLTVATTGSDYGLVQTNGTISVGTYAGNSANASEGGWYGTLSNHPLYFFTAASEPQAMLSTNGFFGIGTTTPLGALDVRRAPSSLGTAFFQGTTYGSVFNYSTAEDTYIRGGKAGSNVIINDAALGNVGIGTDSPVDKLTVRTNSNNYGIIHTDGTITVGSYVGGGAGWLGTKTNQPLYFFTNNGNAQVELHTDGTLVANNNLQVNNILTVGTSSSDDWHIFTSAQTHLAFAWNTPANPKGYINFLTGDYVSLSDARLKENVVPYKQVLRDIKNLHISTYHYKSDATGSRSFGLIAQNAAEYFPELVSEITNKDGKKLLGVAYGKTGVLALKAIQEQQVIIEHLQKENNDLKSRIERLEKMIFK